MYESNNERETVEIGERIGKRLKEGDVVCLYGDLGSGKTTMVKGIASVIGVEEKEITSPSFIIIAEHEGSVPFYHIDLYRISRERVHELGLKEYLYGSGISVIEWAEKADEEIPDASIRVRITYAGEHKRVIDIKGIHINDGP
jgi:tRNA threonylcarbamoyladenosine biosynthesis protein TsaE